MGERLTKFYSKSDTSTYQCYWTLVQASQTRPTHYNLLRSYSYRNPTPWYENKAIVQHKSTKAEPTYHFIVRVYPSITIKYAVVWKPSHYVTKDLERQLLTRVGYDGWLNHPVHTNERTLRLGSAQITKLIQFCGNIKTN